jgi:hypothetical protein
VIAEGPAAGKFCLGSVFNDAPLRIQKSVVYRVDARFFECSPHSGGQTILPFTRLAKEFLIAVSLHIGQEGENPFFLRKRPPA